MSMITQRILSSLQAIKSRFLAPTVENTVPVRNKAVKAIANIKNKSGNRGRPKHRGWKRQHGQYVTAGTILATQRTTRWHPGLYVGMGINATLYAREAGKVIVTCEKINPNWNLGWIKRNYAGREGQLIYKKHFHVIPEEQHTRFKLVDAI